MVKAPSSRCSVAICNLASSVVLGLRKNLGSSCLGEFLGLQFKKDPESDQPRGLSRRIALACLKLFLPRHRLCRWMSIPKGAIVVPYYGIRPQKARERWCSALVLEWYCVLTLCPHQRI